ncbi:MAG: polysaccharide deacetylase family protein [Fusobacteriota bacterium]
MKKYLKYLIIIVFISVNIYADGHIIVLHRFGDERYPSTNISEKNLKEIFDYLNENNYKIVTLEKMMDLVTKKEEVPDDMVAFTIDDAYYSFYEKGFPLFKENNIPYTIFVNTEAVNKNYGDYMNWKQINEVSKYGEIGSHSYSHPHLTKLTKEKLKFEIQKSVEDIENNIEKKVDYFAYPYGEYNETVKKEVIKKGFKAIFNQSLGAVSKKSDIYDINRMAVESISDLKWKLNIKYLSATWNEVIIKDKIIKKVNVSMDENIKKVQIYLSGYGWEEANVENGTLNYTLNKEIKMSPSRLIIKTYENEWSNKLILDF